MISFPKSGPLQAICGNMDSQIENKAFGKTDDQERPFFAFLEILIRKYQNLIFLFKCSFIFERKANTST